MEVDLLLAGSPCQGFSRNGNGLNFEDPRSKLFFRFVEALNTLNPKYFLLENVDMDREWEDVITSYVGVKPIHINSGLVSPQERLRTYWTNIPGVTQPDDKTVLLTDIIDYNVPTSCYDFTVDEIGMFTASRNGILVRNGTKHKGYLRAKNGDGVDLSVASIVDSERRGRVHKGKIGTLDTGCKWAVCLDFEFISKRGKLRKEPILRWFSMNEYERLQGLPDDYTSGFTNSTRRKMIGNGWNIPTIAHILGFIPENSLCNVVSLFDGISGGQESLVCSGKTYEKYYASEIDKNAIQVTMNNYPNTIQIGDVTKMDFNGW